MNQRQHYSDEILNALIDGELEAKETARIHEAMEHDEILRRRVSDLGQVSELVKAAYQDEIPFRTRSASSKLRVRLWPAAAMLGVLGIGSLLGWHLYEHRMAGPTTVNASAGIQGTLAQLQPTSAALRVLFHVGRKDPKLLDRVLSEAEHLLSMQGEGTPPLFIRIVASHGGLSLFRIDTSQSAQRIARMQQEFQTHIAFVGCGETYGQWGSAPKVKARLLPEMVMVDSGVSELLRRQKQGWNYVRI